MSLVEDFNKADLNNKILLVGYPKSGNTWLQYLLAYITGSHSVNLDDLQNENQQHNAQKLREEKESKHSSDFLNGLYICKTHSLPKGISDIDGYKGIVQIVRDPRDVIVSYYYFIHFFRMSKSNPELVNNYSKLQQSRNFNQMIKKVCGELNNYYQQWRAVPNKIAVKYEDLQSNPEETIRTILKTLNIDAPDFLIKEGIEAYAFSNITGREKGAEENTKFFRKGIVGDYKNHFGSLQNIYVKRKLKDYFKEFNY